MRELTTNEYDDPIKVKLEKDRKDYYGCAVLSILMNKKGFIAAFSFDFCLQIFLLQLPLSSGFAPFAILV